MPELPEVETIRRSLEPKLLQRTIVGGEIAVPKMILYQTPVDFLARVTGQKIVGLNRRGKYLLIQLSGGLILAIHLRMTGQLTVARADSALENAVYFRLHLDNGHELRFRDQRKFGKLFLFPEESPPAPLIRLGPEPLSREFSINILQKRLAGRKLAVKKALLNQDIIAGLGNIYTDEALFLAGIHPARPVDSLTEKEFESLYKAIQQVLSEGIQQRGTTKRDYRDGEGNPGSYQEYLRVYGRKGLPCPKCRNMIVRMNFGGRGTHFCPFCQI
jgi:formamidopyrimidine-DNA glycosylase